MTRILALITGNPLVLLWIVLGSIAFGAATGGSAAWWAQGLNVTAVEQEFTTYRQTQTALIQAEKDRATTQREKAGKDYEKLSGILTNEINDHAVLKRCIAAGKCGVRQQPVACSPSIRLPSIGGNDDPSAYPVPATGEHAAEVIDPVVNDCAVTTLRLNRLQVEIEGQEGYSK